MEKKVIMAKKNKIKKKIFCFDIDNTICKTSGSNYQKSLPIKKNINLINKLQKEGHHIKIFTSRYMGRTNSDVKKAKKAGLDIEIVHSPATQIPADADIVVTHQGLAGVAKSAAPENSVLIQYVMFMNDPSLNKLIKDLSEGNTITST